MKNLWIQTMALVSMLGLISACGGGGGGGSSAAPSSEKAITAFSFTTPAAAGTIDETAKTIRVSVPFGTNVTALVATFVSTGASVEVNGAVQASGATSNDFTSPLAYIVTAADASAATYTVTVGRSGSLDASFGAAGASITPVGTGSNRANAVALQSNGKIVVAGYGGNDDFTLVRYNADGTLDTTFHGDGMVTTPVGTSSDAAEAVAIQVDGKIVAAGDSYNGHNYEFALARYNADGSLDTTFNGSGIVTTPVWSTSSARAVALQADGKIVAAGYAGTSSGSETDFALVRYNTDGSLDTSFHATGIVSTPIGTGSDWAYAVAIQPDGKIVAAGTSVGSSASYFALARYNTNGSLDTTFNSSGTVTTPLGTNCGAYTVAIQADGKIVAAGGSNGDFSLARYNTDGTLDTTFNTTGKVSTPIGTSSDTVNAVVIQSDGKIVAVGYSLDDSAGFFDFALARYNANGSLDTDFGMGGIVTTPLGPGHDMASAAAIQANGDIVVAGGAENGTDFDFAVVRYHY